MAQMVIAATLISTFEGGFQPVTLASAAAALIEAGHHVTVVDTYVDGPEILLVENAALVAIAVPLFDSLVAGIEIAKRVRKVNPRAHISFFGQYATINSLRLIPTYGDSCVVGEWEEPLVALAGLLAEGRPIEVDGLVTPACIDLGKSPHPYFPRRKTYRLPARDRLPPLSKYPQPQVDALTAGKQITGSIEVARGCHHKCLYCSVFAAYDGRVLPFSEDNVLADVRQMMADGMTHLSFMDADFFSLKKYGAKIIRRIHAEFPALTFDFTTRIDHILENKDDLVELAGLNVAFVTSALEFPSKAVLDAVAKETTLEMIEEAVRFLLGTGIKLNPTFIMFNPWISLEDLATFHAFVERNGLESIVDPIQYQTRLNLYKGSPLLQSQALAGIELIEHEFHYDWRHPDSRVDAVFQESLTPVEEGTFKRCCLKC